MRSKRYSLFLDPRYAVEREIRDIIKAAPEREGNAFIRALILLGYQEKLRDKARDNDEYAGKTGAKAAPK